MVTALNLYGNQTQTTTLTTADQLVNTATGTTTSGMATRVGTATGYSELYSHGTSTAWGAAGSLGSPSGHGFLWDVTTLEGQQIVAGNWTPLLHGSVTVGTLTATLYMRAYVYNAGTYTHIGDMSLTGQSFTTTSTAYNFSATSLVIQNFGTGDKLYLDVWFNVTANSTGSSTADLRLATCNNAGLGRANNMEVDTPGYQLIVTNNAMSFEDDLVVSDLQSALQAWNVDSLSAIDSRTQLGQDTFTRSDVSNGWGTGTDGQVWTVVNGTATDFAVTSNEGQIINTIVLHGATYGTSTAVDQEILVRTWMSDAADRPILLLRQTAATTRYEVKLVSNFIRISKRVAGTLTDLTNSAFTPSSATWYWMRAQVIGSTINARVWADGTSEPSTWNVTATDTDITDPGQYGLGTVLNGPPDTVQFDNFTAYRLVAGFVASDRTGFGENLLASDMQSALQAWTMDSLSVTDSLSVIDTIFLAETPFAISDTLLGQEGTLFGETAPVSDLQSALQAWTMDTLTASENAFFTQTVMPTEGLGILDIFLPQENATWVDATPIIAESVTFGEILLAAEALSGGVTDSLLDTATYLPLDVSALSDTFSTIANNQMASIENLLVSDTFLAQDGNLFLETSSGVSESFNAQETYISTESLSSLDLYFGLDGTTWVELVPGSDLSSSMGGTYFPLEGLAASDSVLGQDLFLSLDLFSSLSDAFSSATYRSMAATESLLVSDAFLAQTGYTVLEPLGMLETFLARVLAPLYPVILPALSAGPFWQGNGVLPIATSQKPYMVNGWVLDSQPIICTTPLSLAGNVIPLGSTFILIFSSPTSATQTALAAGSTVTLRFGLAAGDSATGQVQITSTATVGTLYQVICTVMAPIPLSTFVMSTPFF